MSDAKYIVTTISWYPEDRDHCVELVELQKRAGVSGANRSSTIRAALRLVDQDELIREGLGVDVSSSSACDQPSRSRACVQRSHHGGMPPKVSTVDRNEDMSPKGVLRLDVQDDGDVVVCVAEERTDGLRDAWRTVEFCAPGAGGGRSRHTHAALLELAAAMQRDNDRDALPVSKRVDFDEAADAEKRAMVPFTRHEPEDESDLPLCRRIRAAVPEERPEGCPFFPGGHVIAELALRGKADSVDVACACGHTACVALWYRDGIPGWNPTAWPATFVAVEKLLEASALMYVEASEAVAPDERPQRDERADDDLAWLDPEDKDLVNRVALALARAEGKAFPAGTDVVEEGLVATGNSRSRRLVLFARTAIAEIADSRCRVCRSNTMPPGSNRCASCQETASRGVSMIFGKRP